MTTIIMRFVVTLALLAAVLAMGAALLSFAHAQQRTVYGPDGRVVGRIATDSQGTRTVYDERGKVVIRESGPDPRQPRK